MRQLLVGSLVLLASWYGVNEATRNLPAGDGDGVGLLKVLGANGNQDSDASQGAYPRAFLSLSQTLKNAVGIRR